MNKAVFAVAGVVVAAGGLVAGVIAHEQHANPLWKSTQRVATRHYTTDDFKVVRADCRPHTAGVLDDHDHDFRCRLTSAGGPERTVRIHTYVRHSSGRRADIRVYRFLDGVAAPSTTPVPAPADDPPDTAPAVVPHPDYEQFAAAIAELRRDHEAAGGVRQILVDTVGVRVAYATRRGGAPHTGRWDAGRGRFVRDPDPIPVATLAPFPITDVPVGRLTTAARRIARREGSALLPDLNLLRSGTGMYVSFHVADGRHGSQNYGGPLAGPIRRQ